jgi:DNA topoisomerase-1
VQASVGHIRDLPNKAGEVPEKYKKEKWAKLGVDVAHGFTPLYVVPADKKSRITELRKRMADADELLLATDEDREGEAIAWHLLEVLKPKVPVRRMVFHEITRDAIAAAASNTRDLDQRLVDAQETRRIIDRLYGYEVSPVLWRKVTSGLSAGRVQSVAVRLVVERERERIAFVRAGYFDLTAACEADGSTFEARLVAVDGRKVATGRDFGADGRAGAEVVVLDEPAATSLAAALAGVALQVAAVEEKPYRRRPAAPFMTSTLQQEASRKLRMTAQTAMRVAQKLYENGYITYMRTDSTTLSETALSAARAAVVEAFGRENLADAPRQYAKKVKNAQEAHEAIRPSGDRFRTPGELAGELARDELALYDLIWKRTVASQMTDATGTTASLRLAAVAADGRETQFAASGTVITHKGFLNAYEEGRDEPAEEAGETRLPALAVGDSVGVTELSVDGHETSPPARYTEATLVRALEERGIGRPSTYAAILGTITNRGYVFKRGTALVPSWTAFSVVALLERHFAALVDYDFTAQLEEVLDRIASGNAARNGSLQLFYFGDADRFPGLEPMVSGLGEIDAKEINSFPITDAITLRVGKFGPYLEELDTATGEVRRANVPDDLAPDELTPARSRELLDEPTGDTVLGQHPETGLTIVTKKGKYGPYVLEELPEGAPKSAKARTASLFASMSLDTVTLDDAVRLLSLPRVVGVDADGAEITAQNGPYGPYLKKAGDSRSLTSEEQIFGITLAEAQAIYSQPKSYGRKAAAPLRELGNDPVSGRPILVKDGKFGPYVTDGEFNATLRKGDSPESITSDRAAELIAEKRAKGPAPKKASRRPAAKKPAAKKAAAKRPAKRAAARG